MKKHWPVTLSLSAILLVSACAGGSPSQGAPSATAAPAAVATTAPTTAATPVPPTATLAPATPTVIPSPTSQPATPTARAAAATPAPTKAAATSAGPAIEESDVRKMAVAWASAKSYRAKFEGLDEGARATWEMEVVMPDRTHWSITAGDQVVLESISIGSDSYTKQGGTWVKSTSADALAAMTIDPSEIVDNFKEERGKGNTWTKGQSLTVNGVVCQEWIDSSEDGGTICIGSKDSLPVQFKSNDGEATITFSDWNTPIKIDPPI